MGKIKIGIVGTGGVTRKSYLPYLSTVADVEIGLYGRNTEKTQACSKELKIVVFDSLAKLMAWGPDSVMLLTKETDRLAAANEVLSFTPKRIFFEKPLTAAKGQANVSEEDFFNGAALLKKAQTINCQTAMIFNYRFFEHSLLAKQIIQERGFGKVLNVTALVHFACWSHCIDLIHAFAGTVTEISAFSGTSVREAAGMKATDVCVAFRTSDDAVGTILGSNALTWDLPLFEMTFNFERGRIRFQDLDGDMEVSDCTLSAKFGRRQESYGISKDKSRWDPYLA